MHLTVADAGSRNEDKQGQGLVEEEAQGPSCGHRETAEGGAEAEQDDNRWPTGQAGSTASTHKDNHETEDTFLWEVIHRNKWSYRVQTSLTEWTKMRCHWQKVYAWQSQENIRKHARGKFSRGVFSGRSLYD